jgi:hypothetical protein
VRLVTNELSLKDELRRLQRLDKPQRAGYEFEDLVAGLFRREHFSVERHARAAAPRQADLCVKRSNNVYLVETKYRRKPATINDIDSLFTRLDATPSDVVGILCSQAGFSKSVVSRVAERSSRPVLLIIGNELNAVGDGIENFPGMLRRKRASLLTHREVELDRVHHVPTKLRPPVDPLPASDELFVYQTDDGPTFSRSAVTSHSDLYVRQRIRIPEIAREITKRWISEVPSKMV